MGRDLQKMRKAAVQRNILVNCPVHGKKFHRQIGHHISVKRRKQK